MAAGQRVTPDDVAEALRGDILTGRLLGGHVVSEAEVSERFSVSRTPVREAVARLLAEGMLVKGPSGRGATVFRPTLDDLREIYEIRIALETLAARLASQNATSADVLELRHLCDSMDSERGESWILGHTHFHVRLYECSRRKHLVELIRTLRHKSDPYIRMYVGTEDTADAQKGHREMVATLAAGDADAASAATEAHLLNTLTKVEGLLR